MMREEAWLLEEKYHGVASAAFAADKERLASGEPLAYIIGWQPFLGLKIYLDSRPLIPRPETEHWVEELSEKLASGLEGRVGRRRPETQEISSKKLSVSREDTGELRVLDLCAGSGAIGCALLKNVPGVQVSFGEIEPAHEATIRKNIRENGLDESRADIRIGDLFAPFEGVRFDYIAANPPYIPEERALEPSVAEHEPQVALRSGADGLDLIRRIAEGLRAHLNPGGEAWVECDSEHAEAAARLFTAQGFSARVEKDQYGRSRLLVIS